MIIQCPHCDQWIEIIELRCRIFRCGIYIKNQKQIDPHSSKKKCDDLVEKKLIYGCGKPFLIKKQQNDFNVEKCDYI